MFLQKSGVGSEHRQVFLETFKAETWIMNNVNKKFSCRWQTARRLYMPMLCCHKLPSGEWLRFIGRILRLLSIFSHMASSMRGIPSSYRVHIWYGKTRMAGLQSDEGRMMTQYINVTNTHTDRQTDRQTCRHSKWRVNASYRATKIN